VAWLALVALLIALGYGSRIASGKPDPEVLYRWSTAIGGLIQDGIVLGVVLAIAGGTSLLALRRPKSLPQAAAIVGIAIVAIYAFEAIYSAIVHPGNERSVAVTRRLAMEPLGRTDRFYGVELDAFRVARGAPAESGDDGR